MSGYGPVTFDTTTVPVSGGEARLPGRYPHDFASVPEEWRTVATASKYVSFPTVPPGTRGHLRIFGGESVGERLEFMADRVVYAGSARRRSRWQCRLDEARYRLAHAIAALRGSCSECDY